MLNRKSKKLLIIQEDEGKSQNERMKEIAIKTPDQGQGDGLQGRRNDKRAGGANFDKGHLATIVSLIVSVPSM